MLESVEQSKERSIKEQLRSCRHGVEILFAGPEDYRILLKTGILTPEVSSVRLRMPDSMDRFYSVLADGKLEGRDDLCRHAAPSGIVHYSAIITQGQQFEIELWNREAV